MKLYYNIFLPGKHSLTPETYFNELQDTNATIKDLIT